MKRKPYRYLLYLGLRLMQGLAVCLPRRTALALGERIGAVAFHVACRERERTILHLTWAYGREKNQKEIYTLARRVFTHWGRVAVEVLRFPKLTKEEVDCFVEKGDGLSLLHRLLREGRGVILLTAHLGNWELLGALLRFHGFQGAVVGRRVYYERFNEIILRLRKSVTLQTLYQDAPVREFLKILRQNQILGILADQDIDRLDGVFVPFFGRPAYALTAPARLALISGAPLLPVFLVREGDRYRLLVEEPIRVEARGTRQETIQEYTQRWSRVIEEKIRAFPEQWAWMHRRWKTQTLRAEPACDVV